MSKTKILEALAGKPILDGVYLNSAEVMKDDQGSWDDEDPSKDFDFNDCDYWVTFDDGAEPEGFDDDEDLLNYLSDTRKMRDFIKFNIGNDAQ